MTLLITHYTHWLWVYIACTTLGPPTQADRVWRLAVTNFGMVTELCEAVIYSLTEIETETENFTFALTGTETKPEMNSKTENRNENLHH